MRTYLSLPILFLLLSLTAFSQDTKPETCPDVTLIGPANLLLPGNTGSFNAVIDTKGKYFELKYKWTVIGGEIITGQYSTQIEVKKVGDERLSAQIEITGFRPRCTNMFSKMQGPNNAPAEPTKIDEFDGPLSKFDDDRFKKINDAVRENRDAQIYVYLFFSTDSRISPREKREEFLNRLGRLPEDYRMTFVEGRDKVDKIIIWLVPPEANPPEIDN